MGTVGKLEPMARLAITLRLVVNKPSMVERLFGYDLAPAGAGPHELNRSSIRELGGIRKTSETTPISFGQWLTSSIDTWLCSSALADQSC